MDFTELLLIGIERIPAVCAARHRGWLNFIQCWIIRAKPDAIFCIRSVPFGQPAPSSDFTFGLAINCDSMSNNKEVHCSTFFQQQSSMTGHVFWNFSIKTCFKILYQVFATFASTTITTMIIRNRENCETSVATRSSSAV